MIHNMTGGGAGLALTVVGGTAAPASPKENTIWLSTSTAVSGYAFSATAPASPASGMVWIKTGDSANVPINIAGKNTVLLYPVGCKQYVSGAWVSKTARTYQSGKWQDWSMFLYNYGETELEISFETDTASNGSLQANYIHMESTNKYGGNVSMSAGPALDLTPYTVAKIELENTGSYATMTIGFGATLGTWDVAKWQYQGEMSKTTVTIDISELSGEYYLGAQRVTNSDSRAVGITKIYSVCLE